MTNTTKLAMFWLACSGCPAILAQSSLFSVEDPRPVAKAIEILEVRNGWLITFEDLPHAHSSEVRSYAPPGVTGPDASDPAFLGPAGGKLFVGPEVVSPQGIGLANRLTVVQAVLDAEARRRGFTAFAVQSGSNMLHVVPVAHLAKSGGVEAVSPLLDAEVSLSSGEATALQFIRSLCEALRQVTHKNVAPGTISVNLSRYPIKVVAPGKARDLLTSVLEQTGQPLSWQLFYDPGVDWYVLNIHRVDQRSSYGNAN